MDQLNIVNPDECCSEHLSKALLYDSLLAELKRWTCPECETEWEAQVFKIDQGEGVLQWIPRCPIVIFKT